MVAARRRRVHRRGAQDERRQVLQEDAPGEVRRLPGAEPLTAGDRILPISDVAGRVLATPPTCGATRLVCIDGPSGSGKSSLAQRLAGPLGDPPLVQMDDLY